ncbi:hypothetical protein B0H11DRAFT_2280069 [Mycena galericulata]|nr:hypothetical protein B0H11DRAFT_2280069 [Mycena galericulata]
MEEQHSVPITTGPDPGEHSQQWSLDTDNLGDGPFPEKHDKGSTSRISSATDFIKKLYRILSDNTDENVIAWAPQRDRFVVKDADEFRKTVLPRMFKHSNFASFVRQLNKYGFSKIKSIDDPENARHWTFQHPDFHADRRYALDDIKRKAPVQRNAPSKTSGSMESPPNANIELLRAEVAFMRSQLASLGTVVGEALSHVRTLQHSHQKVLVEMMAFQRGVAQQDRLLTDIIQRHSRANYDGSTAGSPSFDRHSATLLLGQTQDIPQASRSDSRRDRSLKASGSNTAKSRRHTLARIEELQAQHMRNGTPPQGRAMSPERDQMVSERRAGSPDWEEYVPGLDVPLASNSEEWSPVGRTGSEGFENWPSDGNTFADDLLEESVFTSSNRYGEGSGTPPQSPLMPRWVVAPHVLVVEDDAISRKLSSKFLQVFGCTNDVAVDGVDAVNKMTEAKYDLVLMDIDMPKLDGVSATSMIRTFDQHTPIISMTSHTTPTELMTYSSSGMNDILLKPFKKGVLLDILQKHLAHLTLIRQQTSASMGFTPFVPSPEKTSDHGSGNPDAGDGNLDAVACTDNPDNAKLSGVMSNNDFNLKHGRDLYEEPRGRERKRIGNMRV